MSVFSKYQRNMSIDWGIDTSSLPFTNCTELKESGLIDVKIPIYGLFITLDNGYGESPVAILEDKLLSMPQRYLDMVKDFMDDPDVVNAIKAKNAAIIISTFESKKYKKTGYDIEFVELNDPEELPFK